MGSRCRLWSRCEWQQNSFRTNTNWNIRAKWWARTFFVQGHGWFWSCTSLFPSSSTVFLPRPLEHFSNGEHNPSHPQTFLFMLLFSLSHSWALAPSCRKCSLLQEVLPLSLLRAACPTCGSVKGGPGAPHLPILQQIITPQPSWETTALSPALPYAPPPPINLQVTSSICLMCLHLPHHLAPSPGSLQHVESLPPPSPSFSYPWPVQL